MGDGQGGPKPPEAIAAPDVEAIGGSGFFAQPIVHRYVWSQDYTARSTWRCCPPTPGTSPPRPGSGRRCSGESGSWSPPARARRFASTT